jgi:transposase-like protein
MTTRKTYSTEYKLDAVSLVKDQISIQSETAKHLGIGSNMLRRWIKERLNRLLQDLLLY